LPPRRKAKRSAAPGEPVRGSLTSARFERLTLAIAAATGIESFIWLVDVGGADAAAAAAILKSTCNALLEHELGITKADFA
jgi:hypothetical protein